MIGSGAGGGPGGPRAAAGDSSGVDDLGCSPPSALVGLASDASRAPGVAATATATGGTGAYSSRYTQSIRGWN